LTTLFIIPHPNPAKKSEFFASVPCLIIFEYGFLWSKKYGKMLKCLAGFERENQVVKRFVFKFTKIRDI
jgi:hypothetical protein